MDAVTSEAELQALYYRGLVDVSVGPDIGEPLPGESTVPQLRQYVDDAERIRLVYWGTVLRTMVVVAFIEA